MADRARRLQKHTSLRRNSAKRGYDRQWRNARIGFLRENPFCVECAKDDRYIASTVVDHITPHRGDEVLFWARWNWQALCKRCHDRKTARGE
ncbi:HNH endonuclease signature motif containing protein [Pirellulaceae bacterium SH501]